MTIIEQLATFATDTTYESLPDIVREESRRIILDSVGCAVAGVPHPKGAIGIDFALATGAGADEATIMGTPHRVGVLAATFANAELINALDFDAVLPPGHVVPFVLPGALAIAEKAHLSGKQLIAAVAVAHEMSNRFGKAMDHYRTIVDGEVVLPRVVGFSSTVLGAVAAAGRLKGFTASTMAHALAIGATTLPVNSMRSWLSHAPSSTTKYSCAGVLAQSAMTAALLGELGHRGDVDVLDDATSGFAAYIGTQRWEPAAITEELGASWHFTKEQAFKPYPHCRILHAPLDVLTELVATHNIRPDDIESIRVLGEAWVGHPVWQNREIEQLHDAQFSIAHGLAVGAQGVPPGPAWQDPALVFNPSVLQLMDKITFDGHPEWISAFSGQSEARPTRVEVVARGERFSGEASFPKGSPHDAQTYLANDELVAKFRLNVVASLGADLTERLARDLLNLDEIADIAAILDQTRTKD